VKQLIRPERRTVDSFRRAWGSLPDAVLPPPPNEHERRDRRLLQTIAVYSAISTGLLFVAGVLLIRVIRQVTEWRTTPHRYVLVLGDGIWPGELMIEADDHDSGRGSVHTHGERGGGNENTRSLSG
jgi:hypothetical protein